jgi:hypothetical protein
MKLKYSLQFEREVDEKFTKLARKNKVCFKTKKKTWI